MSQVNKCSTCDGKGQNTRGQRCLDCNGTGNFQEPEIIRRQYYCPNCNHDNFSDPAIDDLTAACNCDCHDDPEQDDEFFDEMERCD